MEWPLVGRRGQLETIVAAFRARDGGGLVLHGPAGVGKTRLLDEARQRATATGTDVHAVVATAASRAIPFAPFADLIPSGLGVSQPGGLLDAVAEALTASPAALAVDDAHLLDAGSAALLHDLARRQRIPVVVTVRDGEPVPDAVRSLWTAVGLRRLPIGDLDRGEVAEVLGAVLGGDVSSSLVDELARLSHGNPLLLREVVTLAVRAGTVARREELWVATDRLVRSDGLPGAIAERLDALPPAVRAAAELIALAEPVGAAIVESLVRSQVRAQLDDERLLAAVADRRRATLRLVHPLYAEVLRATIPPLRAREHARRLAGAVTATGRRRREDRLRIAVWHLDGGRRDEPDLYLAASADAHAVEDHELATRLAEAALDGGGLPAQLALLRQLPYVGRLDEALATAGDLAAAVIEPPEVVAVAVVHARLHVIAGDLAAADELLRRALETASAPELRGRVLVELAATAHDAGEVTRALAFVDELVAVGDPQLTAIAAPAGVRTLAHGGRTQDALALVDLATDAIDETARRGAALRHRLAMASCQALGYDGDLRAALELGEERAAASHDGLRGAWLRDVGQLLLLVGRPRSARLALRQMLAELPLAGTSAVSALWALDALAEACALTGDAAAAAAAARDAAERCPPGFRAPRTSGVIWAAAAAGELRRARRLALAAAHEHLARGAVVVAATTLHDLARLGGAATAAELVPTIDVRQSRLVRALVAATVALASDDPPVLLAGADQLEQLGATLLAAELAARAAYRLRADGRPGPAAAARHRASSLQAGCEGARTPLLATLRGTPDLTDREWEVAHLVAGGLTDREVADRLQVSVRTVHSHLHHAYAKLQVAGRDQLSALLTRPHDRPRTDRDDERATARRPSAS